MLEQILNTDASSRSVIIVGSIFLLWRLWHFSVKSWLDPAKVKELPHWIPLFGHVYSFFYRSVELMEKCIDYTGRSHEPVAINLFNMKLYIVTKPKDVTEIFNNTTGIDNDYSLREVLLAYGVTKKDLARAWQIPKPNEPFHRMSGPQQMCFIKWVQDGYRKYLLTPQSLEQMCGVFVDSLLYGITKDSLSYCMAGKENLFSLYMVVRNVMVEASTQSMFGPHLHEIDPNIVEHMLGFNDNAWQVVMRHPDFFGSLAVSKPRKRMMSIMKEFVSRPQSQTGLANEFVKNVLAGMEATKLEIHSRAAMMLMIFWAAVSNEYNATFWLMAHLLYDESLLEQVREETDAAWICGELDTKYLGENCPVLEAVFNEVLRHKNAAGAMRMIANKTQIGTKELQPGNVAYIPFHQLHTNEKVWGDGCLEFDHTRFLKKKSLARNASFRPFGGGTTYCPGRSLAKREVFSAVAIMLHRFDARLAATGEKKQPFPILNIKTPSLGLNGPVNNMDIIVQLIERKTCSTSTGMKV